MKTVEMRFKGVRNTIEVPEHRVERYEDRGWVRVSPEPGGYGQLKKPELVAEIERRNEGREAEDVIDASGTVPELRQRLEDDDAR